MERSVNTYQGMNKDIAYDSIPPNLYIDALDIRITTTNGESMGTWTNLKGNKEAFTIPSVGTFNSAPWTALNPEIIGYTTVRDKIILFVADDSNSKGWIYEVKYDPASREILPGFPLLKYYSAQLAFNKKWPIEAIGRFESDCLIRIYWTDYNNYLRSINIEDPNLATFPAGQVDVFPDIEYKQPLLKIITGGGVLQSGVYQVAYRLSTTDGKQTLISPPSNIVHVVADSDTGQSGQYNGDPVLVVTGKSLQFELDTSTYTDFDKIEFIVNYCATGTTIPEIISVESLNIGNPTTTFVYTGNEGSAFPIEVFEFIIKNHGFKTCKTLTQKDNSLVIANIKGSTINVQSLLAPGETFDAKTRRYKNVASVISTPYPIDPNPEDPSGNNLKNAFNEDYNVDAHWDTNWHTDQQYRYKSDGVTLGGQGPNISYKFHLEPFTLDGEKATAQGGYANVADIPDFALAHNLNDGYGTYANTTWPNHASPFISGLLRGYKRGETYRFGIIFYTKKGEATYVEYIGDIKFPDISERDAANNASGTRYWPICQISPTDNRLTIAYAMGIEFNISFASCPSLLNVIESYQIVRVERGKTDKRRFSQGIMKSFFFNVIESQGSGVNFNFEATNYGNNRNVLHLLPHSKVFGGSYRMPHSFGLIGDHQSAYNNIPASSSGGDYLIKSQYVAFLCPEISFDYDREEIKAQSNNPCLLMTGAYDELTFSPFGSIPNTPLPGTGVYDNYAAETAQSPSSFNTVDLSSENLSKFGVDIRKKYCASVPVNYNSIENIKKLTNTEIFSMPDNADFQACVTPYWATSLTSSSHMRNFYAIDNTLDDDDQLNNPDSGLAGNNEYSEVSKGGTALLATTDRFFDDPLTGSPVTSAPTDFFRIAGNTTLPGGIDVLYSTTPNPNFNLKQYYPILDVVLPKKEIYGGYSKNALETNIFISASPVINTANTNPKVFGGDIFITYFTAQTSTVPLIEDFFDVNASGNPKFYARAAARTETIPVETTMNLELAYGATTRTEVWYTYGSTEATILRQETDNNRTTYGKVKNMYSYLSLYSRENKDVTFTTAAEGETDCKINDIRAYLSNVKVNTEIVDSWTQFPINNYYDIDDYGPINKILNWKDTVHFIQDKAVGIYAINRAAITTTADGVPTSLGTGEGFGKHQYYSKEHGAIHQWAVQATENGIYYFDALHRKFYRIEGTGIKTQNAPISEIKGIHSWLQNLPDVVFLRKETDGDNPILKKGVTVGYDKINDEVIFTFLGTGTYLSLAPSTEYPAGTIVFVPGSGNYYLVTETFSTGTSIKDNLLELLQNSELISPDLLPIKDTSIVLDEIVDQFSSRYSAAPKIWINNGDILMSPDPRNPDILYTHNIGDWGNFYGSVEECSITMVLNHQADINKVLRTIEFNSIVRDDNKVIDRTKTITAFKITTEYQSTNKVPFSADRIKRKFDKWRVKIPRNQLSTSQQDRLRSTHFVLTLYFDNLDNKQLICNRLLSYYDFQVF